MNLLNYVENSLIFVTPNGIILAYQFTASGKSLLYGQMFFRLFGKETIDELEAD